MTEPHRRVASTERDRLRRCCAEMLRIRRFEERCVELYSAAKIRGFLHLYIGEEAVAVGVMQRARPPTTPSSRPTASTATRWPAACRRTRSWPRCSASARAAAGAAAARCTSSTPPRASTAATRSSAAGCRSRSAWRWPTAMQGRHRVTACFFGDGAVAEGEFHESLNLAALWRLPVLFCCENNLYAMGTALRPLAVPDRPRAARRPPTGCRRWPVDGMDVRRRRGRRAGAPSTRVRDGGGRASSSCAPTGSARTRCTTPSCYRDQGGGRGVAAARPDRRCSPQRLRADGALDDDELAAHRGRRSPPRSTRAVAFAEAGTLEPVEDLDPLRATPSGGDAHDHDDLPRGDARRRCATRCSATSACS